MSNEITTGQTPFDSIRHVDEQGNEYWSARELMGMLGYSTWQRFEGPITKAKEDCGKAGRSIEEHFHKNVKVRENGGTDTEDYLLTAYACRLVVMASRTRDKDIASKARTYFSDKVEQAELLELVKAVHDDPLAEVARRIALRQELTDANKALIKRAEAAGIITKEQRAIFMNWGYKGLYAGEVEDDIHSRKDLKPSQGISDWMGVVETMANVLRAIIAKRRMDIKGIRTPTDANHTHYLSGQSVRNYLLSEGIYPEQLPTPRESYKELVKREAARIAREEEDEAGLWGQLSGPKSPTEDY